MRLRPVTSIGVAGLLALSVACAVASSPSKRGGVATSVTTAPACLQLSPPCPPVVAPTALEGEWDESAVGFTLLPPPAGVTPAVDATDAVDIGWKEGGADGTSQQATLALLPKGGSFAQDVLVWVVRYDGYCGSPVGNPRFNSHEGKCFVQSSFTMIDAGTGEFIVSWTRPDPSPSPSP